MDKKNYNKINAVERSSIEDDFVSGVVKYWYFLVSDNKNVVIIFYVSNNKIEGEQIVYSF